MLIRYGKEQDGSLKKKAEVYTRDEHKINIADVDSDAVFITGRLRANGFESYIVGGAVRDLILGKKPKDFDIVTDATPARVKRVFRNSRIIGKRFRLVHVFFGERIFEVSTFRSLKDGHTSNTYGTIEEDVLRRDFSCNALFYDPGKQLVVDYVNGMNDIRKKILRPIIPPELIFRDDPVRMIRAVKYAAAGGFSIPWLLRRRIKKEAFFLNQISNSRLTEELSKIIRSPAAPQIIESLEDAGLYGFLQKEASAMMKIDSAFRNAYLKGFVDLVSGHYSSVNGHPPAKQVPPAKQSPSGKQLLSAKPSPLAALIRNYLEQKTPWQELTKSSWEKYKTVFFDVRRFILPMNPPKVELEQAVRLIFAEHGIDLKKIRTFEREKQAAHIRHSRVQHVQVKPDETAKPRRRRRKKSIVATETAAK
ncbi:MAG: polynucleotide adenylyltransferase PcnB [Treponema sp.]|nr:polynucleotide adenylyltransferase PcnB [Treponema sp.]